MPTIDLSRAQLNVGQFAMTADATFNVVNIVAGVQYRLLLSGSFWPTWNPAPESEVGIYDDFAFVNILGTNTGYRIEYEKSLPTLAALRGVPSNFTPGATPTTVANWPDRAYTNLFRTTPPNLTTGEITLPTTALYRITYLITGEQSNSNKELSLIYSMESTRPGSVITGVFDVATDKTAWRTNAATFLYAGQAGEALTIAVNWEGQTIGVYQMGSCTFQVELLGISSASGQIRLPQNV